MYNFSKNNKLKKSIFTDMTIEHDKKIIMCINTILLFMKLYTIKNFQVIELNILNI